MRRNARESAFKIIYQSLFFDVAEDEIDKYVKEDGLNDDDFVFSKNIINKYLQNKNEIKAEIEKKLQDYEYNRIYKIDLALIILALTEVKFLSTAKAIVIDEVIELAKLYSTEKSPKFINGILASILS